MPEDLIKPCVLDSTTKMTYVAPGHKYDHIEKLLKQNRKVCFTKTYGTALSFYTWLKKSVLSRYPDHDYLSQRLFQLKFRELASNIYIRVIDGKVDLKGAPGNTWLKQFFPGHYCYFIGFMDFLGMNGSRQWYEKGIDFPGLSYKLHPYYGTYFPTRFEHLELFDDWLYKNKDYYNKAIDIGAGCGVLVFYMLKHNLKDIYATDINPNAVYSTYNDLLEKGFKNYVELKTGSFFAGFDEKFDLVVFNPPWIPGKANNILDKGIYYEDDTWNDLFYKASNNMAKGGSLLLLYSNFAQLAGISNNHPVKEQLSKNDRFTARNVFKKDRKNPVTKSRKHWLQELREEEKIELWEIEFKG